MSDNAFDQRIDHWKAEQQTPWAQLKYRLVADTLRATLPPAPAQILDAGGGDGVEALALARQGYRVTVLDSSAAMLAEARQTVSAEGLTERCAIIQGDLGQMAEHVPPGAFDAALCHNVLQYVPNVQQLLADLGQALRPGGLLSLLSINRHSVPFQAAFLHHDLERALRSLDERQQLTTIFARPMTLYAADEIIAMLERQGFIIVAHVGIRCLCDYWGSNEEKQRPEVIAQIEALERRLMQANPYKDLARYYQILARRI
jgi:S-adenosylmethionine-dependent methyltransferase